MNATCNLCNEFVTPWDEIGKVLMEEHLREKHPEEYKAARGRR